MAASSALVLRKLLKRMASRNAAVLQKRERCTKSPTTEPKMKAMTHSATTDMMPYPSRIFL